MPALPTIHVYPAIDPKTFRFSHWSIYIGQRFFKDYEDLKTAVIDGNNMLEPGQKSVVHIAPGQLEAILASKGE
jgi:hypothetical protein